MAETTPSKLPTPVAAATSPAKPTGWNRTVPQINALIRKAEDGDEPALAEVREMLTRRGTAEIVGGNIAKEALNGLVSRYASKSPVTKEAILRKLEELRADLSGTNATALEILLVERVLATWLHLHHLEKLYANKDSFELSVGVYFQKVISAAQKRYLAAIKGLAEVRKLAMPALQVNIAKKQVNVAGGTAVTAG